LQLLRSAALVITNRLHVAMPCLGFGIPVIMVEADSLAFRLTALPPWLKIHDQKALKQLSLDPARYYTQKFRENRSAWRDQVRKRLEERLGITIKSGDEN